MAIDAMNCHFPIFHFLSSGYVWVSGCRNAGSTPAPDFSMCAISSFKKMRFAESSAHRSISKSRSVLAAVSDFHFSISSFGMDAAISIHPFRYQAYSRSVSSPAPCRQQGQLQNSLIVLPRGQHPQDNNHANQRTYKCQCTVQVHLLVLIFTTIRPINANYCIQDTADYIKNHFQHQHSPHREYLGPARLPDTFGTSRLQYPSGPGNPRSPYSAGC